MAESLYRVVKDLLAKGSSTAEVLQVIQQQYPNSDIKKVKRLIYSVRHLIKRKIARLVSREFEDGYKPLSLE